MEKKAEFKQFIAQKMEELHIPGVSIGVLADSGREFFTAGVTNINHPLEVTPSTLFQVGSNTKLMTATMLLVLAAEEKLDLDAPVRSVLTDFAVQDKIASANATIRQLLTHSTGWVGDHFIETGSGEDALEHYVSSMADLPQVAPFNFAFSYNNASFAMAGAIIEKVTGKSYEQALADMLFKPLGMTNSFMSPADVMLHRFAVGHGVKDGEIEVIGPWPLPLAMWAAGAVAASAEDMLTFAQFYLDGGKTADGTQFIQPDVMAQMWEPQFQIGPETGWIAHSWFVEEHSGHKAFRHGGATVGQLSAFKLIPSKNFAFVSLTNGINGRIFNDAIESWLLEHVCHVSVSDEAPAPIEPSETMRNEIVGTYSRPFVDLEIKQENDQLMMQVRGKQGFPSEHVPPRPPTPWFELQFMSESTVLAANGPMAGTQGQLVRHADGILGWLRFSMRLHEKIEV
ncbi:MAG: serine hydrolase domain-containing protein [Chloroflexota bacterium]